MESRGTWCTYLMPPVYTANIIILTLNASCFFLLSVTMFVVHCVMLLPVTSRLYSLLPMYQLWHSYVTSVLCSYVGSLSFFLYDFLRHVSNRDACFFSLPGGHRTVHTVPVCLFSLNVREEGYIHPTICYLHRRL